MRRITQCHRAKVCLGFIRQIDKAINPALDLHVILDKSSTHKTAEVKSWLAKHLRVKLHFTTTSASWLNAVECWFASLERGALYRGAFGSVQELQLAIRQFINAHNSHGVKPFCWKKRAEAILARIERTREVTVHG